MRALYSAARRAAADNWSEMYAARTTAGLNPMGPCQPRTGAAHRCAYWAGRLGTPSLYSRDRKIMAYAAYRAGVDDRRADERSC